MAIPLSSLSPPNSVANGGLGSANLNAEHRVELPCLTRKQPQVACELGDVVIGTA
jgi:hypothetical protein